MNVYIDNPKERLIEQDVITEIYVEKPIEKVVEVPVEKIVNVPVEKVIEKPVKVDIIKKVPVYKYIDEEEAK